MGTYKDLQDRINSDFLNRDMGETTKRAITSAIRKYSTERAWYNETSTAVTTVANRSYLSVPSDFWELDRLEIQAVGQWTDLIETDFDIIRVMNTTGQAWLTTHFAYRGDRFELAMIPDSAYPIMCYYLHTIPVLVNDNDSNVWTNEGSNLIGYEAAVDLLANTIVGNPQQIGSLKVERDEALARWNELKAQRMPNRLRATPGF